MVASSAFEQLSEVLARLESSGTDVRHATVDEDLSGAAGEVTADLSVDVPLLSGCETDSVVSIEADRTEVRNGRITVDLQVTVSGTADGARRPADDAKTGATGSRSVAGAVPAYKDPEALRRAYREYDTFPEMTEALGVNVTSETVRRHMVEYDIHDPGDTRPQSYARAARGGSTDERRDAVSEAPGDEVAPSKGTGTADATSNAGRERLSSRGGVDETEPANQSAVTDGGSAAVVEPDTGTDTRRVVDVVSVPSAGDAPVADLPEALTVDELANAVNRARTVRKAAKSIGLGQGATRRLLREFGLIHFVSHPLAADQVTASTDAVARRLRGDEC